MDIARVMVFASGLNEQTDPNSKGTKKVVLQEIKERGKDNEKSSEHKVCS